MAKLKEINREQEITITLPLYVWDTIASAIGRNSDLWDLSSILRHKVNENTKEE